MNFKQIYEGWKNLLVPSKELKEKIQEVSQTRLELCNTCKYKSSTAGINICGLCKCPLSSKTACLSCRCALFEWEHYNVPQEEPKWDAVLERDEEYDIDDKLMRK